MNARFWAWWNAGWVKITLRPGQTVTVETGTGRASRIHRFDFDGISVGFKLAAYDEDGPYRTSFVCPLADLASIKGNAKGDRPQRPDWRMDPKFVGG